MAERPWRRDPRIATIALVVGAAAWAVAHVAAVFTEGANWDEFVLMARAEVAARTGVLDGGGRPGLGVALLVPFVDGCDATIDTLRTLRLLWAGFTFALLGGLFVFVRAAARRSSHATHAAALAVASLALVPLFERWSLQVRTDQPAIAAALWGGVALLASRDRRWLGAVSGALFGLGYLFSQKAIYVTALVGAVALGDHYLDRAWAWRRELIRVGGVLAGGLAVLGLYKLIIPAFFTPPVAVSLERGFDLFRWYEAVLRYRLYGSMIPTLYPHLALLGLVFVAAVRAFRLDTAERRPLLIALLVVALGVAVARFHTASFPYFWITIGVFPAVAIGLGWAGIAELLPRGHLAVACVAWLALIAVGARYRGETLVDTQAVQRASFAYADAHLDRTHRGFHPDGALVCRGDPSPVRPYLGQTITNVLGGARGEENQRALIREFRTRPISFVVRTFRMSHFPQAVRTFWNEHYVPYAHALSVLGRAIHGAAGSRHEIDVLRAGRYVWRPEGAARLAIGEVVLAPGDAIELTVGGHVAELRDAVDAGALVLDVGAPPAETSTPFYDEQTVFEQSGIRRDWW